MCVTAPLLRLETCTVDLETGGLAAGRSGRLTERERTLLAYLARRPGQVVSRGELAEHAFGYAASARTRAVDKAMYSLRQKVEADPSRPRHLLTRHGAGYVLVVEGAPAAPPPGALPAPRRPLVGRSAELAALGAAVEDHPFVSLGGLGGLGKTRLAVAYAQRHRASWPGGVAFAPLRRARGVDGVEREVARALGGAGPDGDVGEALAQRGRCLIVLDHADPVTGALAPRLEAWRRRAPEAHFLVTSSEPLRITGAHRWRLGPASPPDAAALYLRCVEAVRPGLVLPEEELRALPSLLDLLDRIPLAIELAAARVRVLPPTVLRARLSDRFRLLVRRRGAPGRGLVDVLDEAWARLSLREQRALGALAEREEPLPLDDGPGGELVRPLADRSWVEPVSGDRYTLLHTVRQYARERLGSAPPEAGIRRSDARGDR